MAARNDYPAPKDGVARVQWAEMCDEIDRLRSALTATNGMMSGIAQWLREVLAEMEPLPGVGEASDAAV